MLKPIDTRAAVEDLKNRTLVSLQGEIARLVYLASTRDYNSGKYYHDGLALRFTEEIADKALAQCHGESFQRMLEAPLSALVSQLDEYVRCACAEDTVRTWLNLEPYRAIMPLNCHPLSARLFCSNVRIALSILESRAKSRRQR